MMHFERIVIVARAVAVALALPVLATAAPWQTTKPTHKAPDWEDNIIAGSSLTVLDLARRIIPDIKSDASSGKITASDLSNIRLIDGVEETGMEIERDSEGQCEISSPDCFWMKDGGERLLVLLLKVNVEGVVIGLFKPSPDATLLDAVTIAQDMHVDVEPAPLWTIHRQHQAFVVQCWHDNSSESYDNYTFISIMNRKLRAIAGPILSSGFTTYSSARERACKTSMTPKFQFARTAGHAYFDLIVTESTLKVCHRESEEWNWNTGIVYRKTARRRWRWSAKSRQYREASRRIHT